MWAWAVVGFVAAGFLEVEPAPALPLDLLGELAAQGPIELETAGVRTLRRLPGIGDRRANAIVRARRRHDPALGDLLLDDVTGIGEGTRERVARALAEESAPARPPPPPAEELVLRRGAADRPHPGP